MQLLAGAVADDGVRELYRNLLASEARHQRAYVDLALTVAPAAEVRERLEALARHEAAVLATGPPMARLHS